MNMETRYLAARRAVEEGAIHYRSIGADLSELQAADDDAKRLSGYAARFNSKSEDMGFRETIDPDAFTRSLKARNDVKALVNHDTGQVIGSTRAGTLDLSLDDRGLKDVVDLPDTTYANDLYAVVMRGDVGHQSFGFTVVRDEWSKDYAERRLLEVRLHEVSIVTFPAYRATSVSARDLARLAYRTEQDAAALADAFDALQAGGELSDDQAALIVGTVERLRPQSDEAAESAPESAPVSLLSKKLDLVAMKLAI